jgi:uncharacterized membrane protein
MGCFSRSVGWFVRSSGLRLLIAAAIGIAVAVGTAVTARLGHSLTGSGCALIGWVVGATVYLVWTWRRVWPMDSEQTKAHAKWEDPTRRIAHAIMFLASVASIGGVGHLLIAGSLGDTESVTEACIGVLSVVAAWVVVHTVFTLHYAKLYYARLPEGGISFNQKITPAYCDFAYLAFTIGMAYAVSDNDIHDQSIRKKALLHALGSYALGAVILAVTINLIAGLGPNGS